MPPLLVPVVLLLAAVVVVVFRCRTAPPFADLADAALEGLRLPDPTLVELGDAGCKHSHRNEASSDRELLFLETGVISNLFMCLANQDDQ